MVIIKINKQKLSFIGNPNWLSNLFTKTALIKYLINQLIYFITTYKQFIDVYNKSKVKNLKMHNK